MEKLELKHLSAYLPYGLKGEIRTPHYLNQKKPIGEVTQIQNTEDGVMIQVCADINNNVFIQRGHYIGESSWIYNFKPILRPLSDLTKEELYNNGFSSSVDWVTNESNHWKEKYGFDAWFERIPTGIYIWLIKNHYDIYELIPKNLAIDINSLPKEDKEL